MRSLRAPCVSHSRHPRPSPLPICFLRTIAGCAVLLAALACTSVGTTVKPADIAVSEFLGSDTAFIQAAVPSPDGRRLGILTTDGTVLVWQLVPRALLGRWIMPGPPIVNQAMGTFPIAFDESGEHLAIGSTDGHVRVWRVDPPLALGGFVPTPPGTLHFVQRRRPSERGDSVMALDTMLFGRFPAQTVSFAPGRFRLAVGGLPGVSIWDLRNMTPLDSVHFTDPSGHFIDAAKLAYTPNGALLVGASDGVIHGLNPTTMKVGWRRDLRLGHPSALVISPQGWIFAAAGMLDSNVVVAEIGFGRVVCRQRVEVVESAVFSSDHGRLLVGNTTGFVVVDPHRCRSFRATVSGPHLAAGAWFGPSCHYVYLASRVSRKIRVYALPKAWWC